MDRYKGFLRQTYHNVALNPRIGCHFLGRHVPANQALEARLLRHIASEMGHDGLALADLAALGEDPEAVKASRPLPATEALAAFVTFQIEHRNPLAYFGYVWHLEALAERLGEASLDALVRLGIPAGAMTFLKEHSENDPVHMRFNREYLEGFVRTEQDLEAVIYGVQGTCELHGAMFQAVVDEAGRGPGQAAATSWLPAAGSCSHG
jgi:pyrroloquinoline quinone (PQQ) biosynthesis protein C